MIENDQPAQGILRTRPLCKYPRTAVYRGAPASTDDAASFDCRRPSQRGDDGGQDDEED